MLQRYFKNIPHGVLIILHTGNGDEFHSLCAVGLWGLMGGGGGSTGSSAGCTV